jgi:hypothetical protein
MPNTLIHIASNIILSGILYLFFPLQIITILTQQILSNLIDLDHLFKRPIYDKNRCSINFHYLHKTWLIPIYCIGLFTNLKWFFLGILLHLLLDYIECLTMNQQSSNSQQDLS